MGQGFNEQSCGKLREIIKLKMNASKIFELN